MQIPVQYAKACEVAVATVRAWLEEHEWPREVIFCCFEDEDATLYRIQLSPPTVPV